MAMVYLHRFELLFECERRMRIKPKMCPANDSRGRHIWNRKDPEMKITLTDTATELMAKMNNNTS